MSENTPTSPEAPSVAPAEVAPRSRRISGHRMENAAKSSKRPAAAADDLLLTEGSEGKESFEVSENPSSHGGWPEPETITGGGSVASDGSKRKRRRKKGKGGGNNPNVVAQPEAESSAPYSDEAAVSSPPPVKEHGHGPRQNPSPRIKLDPEALAKCAWKIYLAEISEEGVALVGDADAKELSRRCFRLAEIFLEEQSRRR